MAPLQLNRVNKSFVVPNPAVVTTLERKFVVRVKDGKADWVDVRQGISKENGTGIFGNLEEGDLILSRGNEEPKPGTEVKTKIMGE